MPDFLAISKPLIERGFSIIPIESGGKRPVPGVGALKRTRFWTQVFAWSQHYGNDLNVGICADENTVILETDDFDRLSQTVKNGTGETFPLTLTACGSSENRPHLFFKRTEKSTNVGNLVVPGLFEARFNNQYVVGPGSVHPGGAVYRWLSDVPIVPIPDWLVSELARLAVTQKGSVSHDARSLEVVGGRVQEGSRHYYLMRELGRLWSGDVSEEELLEKAYELNSQCDPPKDSAHVLQCVRDIMRREPYDPGPTVVLGSKTEEKKTDDSFKHPPVQGKTRDYVLSPLHNDFDGWFPRGRVSLVGGSSGVGKTTLIVDLLQKQKDSVYFLGHRGAGLHFLIIFADRTALSNKETLERMGLDKFDMPIAYMPICWDKYAVNEIQDRIEQYGCPPVVFVEGADALVSDAVKAQTVAPFLSGLQRVAEYYHTSLILSVGAPKTKPKEQYAQTRDRIFGSQMWARMAEDVLVLAYADKDSDDRHLTVEHRNAKKERFTLEWQGGLLVPKAPSTELEGVKETRTAKEDLQGRMLTEIQSLAPGTELHSYMFAYVSPSTFSRYLRDLAAGGWVGMDSSRQWIAKPK